MVISAPVNNYGARFFQKKGTSAAARRFFHIARLYMHGARYESARRFFHISHAMRNESVRFESTRVYMPGARLEKKKPTTTLTTGVRAVGRCHAPVMDKAGDLFGKFARQMQNGVCLDFALPAPKAKRRTLRGGEHGHCRPKSRAKKVLTSSIFAAASCVALAVRAGGAAAQCSVLFGRCPVLIIAAAIINIHGTEGK